MIGARRRRGVPGLGRSAGVLSDPITPGLEIEPGERRSDGLRDVQGQRPVDRDEAVRDERPRAPIPCFDVRLREIGLGEQPGQRRQVRVHRHGDAGLGRIPGRGGGGREGLGSHDRSPVPGCPAVK